MYLEWISTVDVLWPEESEGDVCELTVPILNWRVFCADAVELLHRERVLRHLKPFLATVPNETLQLVIGTFAGAFVAPQL